MTPLKSERLELRPTHPDMFEGIWTAVTASAAELADWMHWAVELDSNGTREYLLRADEAWNSGHDRAFTLFLEGEACGQCSLDQADPLNKSAEIGYWMRSDLCGQGLMTEAAAAVINFGFSREGLHRIELRAGVGNDASIRIAEKLGFREEGLLRDASRGQNGWHDCRVFGLLVTDHPPSAPA